MSHGQDRFLEVLVHCQLLVLEIEIQLVQIQMRLALIYDQVRVRS